MNPTALSADDIESYQRDGVLIVRGLLTPEEVAIARKGITTVLETPSMLAQIASGVDDPGRFVEDFR
ncbi:MAG TPA: phytanoyl-CoA dioxygenase, partial [Phycicoccus sp.]|nr:phytanoyl-CoA dioxygenase [Phycicoccus sp.]